MDLLSLIVCILVIVLVFILDLELYISTDYEIRSGHWWSYFPGSGFYAKYLEYKNK